MEIDAPPTIVQGTMVGGSNTTMKVLVVGLSPALDQVLVLGESEVREASP